MGLMSLSFASTLAVVLWAGVPFYAAALGLAALSVVEHPTSRGRGGANAGVAPQLLLLWGAFTALSLFRGVEGPFAQGQLNLFTPGLRLHVLCLSLFCVALAATRPIHGASLNGGASTGFNI